MSEKSDVIWTTGEDTNIPLSVRDLGVEYLAERGMVKAVRGVNFDLRPEESLALMGESGCGKTTLGLALIRLLAKTASITQGEITYRRDGNVTQVLALKEREMRHFRWSECAMVFQSALNALNPVLRVWDQMYDTVRAHNRTPRAEVRRRALDLFRYVQLDPERGIDAYPHELSGGMRQRVLLAMSLLLDPQIIILDEPIEIADVSDVFLSRVDDPTGLYPWDAVYRAMQRFVLVEISRFGAGDKEDCISLAVGSAQQFEQ